MAGGQNDAAEQEMPTQVLREADAWRPGEQQQEEKGAAYGQDEATAVRC